jgi:hypothetical protein
MTPEQVNFCLNYLIMSIFIIFSQYYLKYLQVESKISIAELFYAKDESEKQQQVTSYIIKKPLKSQIKCFKCLKITKVIIYIL